MRIPHLIGVLILTAVASASLAVPAAASCVVLPGSLGQRLEQADVVFVGTVSRADRTGRIADVSVESVWSGEVQDEVQVQGGPDDPQTITSVDRGFEQGQRYLFVPQTGNGEVFEDNACTDTRPWTQRIDRLRPEGAAAVGAAPRPPADGAGPQPAATPAGLGRVVQSPRPLVWVAGTAAVAVLAVLAVALVRRRATSAG